MNQFYFKQYLCCLLVCILDKMCPPAVFEHASTFAGGTTSDPACVYYLAMKIVTIKQGSILPLKNTDSFTKNNV